MSTLSRPHRVVRPFLPNHSHRTKRLRLAIAIGVQFLSALAAAPAFAWGDSGHRMVSTLAMENLPVEIPSFLRETQVAAMVGELGREADRLRNVGGSYDGDHDPAHFINLDDEFRPPGGVSIDPLPATREDFDTALRAAGSNEYRTGFLPYAIVDGWLQLRKDFAYWRVAELKGRSARKRADRESFARERALREMLIIRDIGYWSHFVADGSQPLHVSIHYDGWGNHPNPHGYNVGKGIHGAFESTLVARHLRAGDVGKLLPPFRDCACSIEVRTIAYLRASHAQLEPLYRLEKSGAFAPTSAGREFAARRLAAATAELRDMIVSAWRESAHGAVGYPALPVIDVLSGKNAPLSQMRGATE